MKQLDEPNVSFALAPSWNTRGIDGYTNAVTNAIDQRKVNCMYMPHQNPATGQMTLYNVKRTGFIIGGTYGTSGQVAHLVENPVPSLNWVFSTSGNDIRASSTSATQVIVTAAGYKPAYVDMTSISGVNYVVLQIRNASFAQRTFYAPASDITTWTEITDSDFTGLTPWGKMEHLDGFAFQLDGRNRIYNSSINSLSDWPTLNYTTKTISQDEPLGLGKFGDRIIAFNRDTFEVFRNAGREVGSPLVRVPDSTQRYGLRATNIVDQRHYCCDLDGWLYWVNSPCTAVLAYNGERVETVSNDSVGRIIQDVSGQEHYGVFRINEGTRDGIAICLTTTAATTQRWLIYFPHLKEWFERVSTVICPTTGHKSHTVLLGVGANQNRLYQPAQSDSWQDDGTNYDAVVQFEMPTTGNQLSFMRWCGIVGTLERSAATVTVSFSDDDGVTWSTGRTIDRTSLKQHLYRCGSYRKRLVRITNSSNHEGRMKSFVARVD